MVMRAESLEILTRADVPPAQALAFVRAIDLELDARGDTLATKADIDRVELKIESTKSELVRWVFSCILGQTAVLLGAAYFFTNLLTRALHQG